MSNNISIQTLKLNTSDLLNEVIQQKDQLIHWFRELHQIPEIDLSLPKTTEYVCHQLKDMGIRYEILPDSTGIIAVIGNKGTVIGIRADMDGLQIKEETGLSYASKNGCMHACAHDAHTAILLTVASLFKKHENDLPGRVKLIFQTAEEPLLGAKYMVKQGVLEDPAVDKLLTLHAGSIGGDYPSGQIVLSDGLTFYSSDSFRITVNGKGGHAASPHRCIDPILTASRIVEALQVLVSREIKPGFPAIVSFAHMHAGTETYNVIPDQAILMGGIRATTPENRAFLVKRAEEIVHQIASSMRADADFQIVAGCPAVINDKTISKQVFQAAEKLFPGEVCQMREAISGSEDAAYFFEKVPGCYLFLSSGVRDENGELRPHHNSKFQVDEEPLWRGAAVMVQAALDLMIETDLQ